MAKLYRVEATMSTDLSLFVWARDEEHARELAEQAATEGAFIEEKGRWPNGEMDLGEIEDITELGPPEGEETYNSEEDVDALDDNVLGDRYEDPE